MQLKTLAPGSPAHGDTVGPMLCLYPLNGEWESKHLPLTANPVVIGRQTSVKTEPRKNNGFFDARVLSRWHAEVWAACGKVRGHIL